MTKKISITQKHFVYFLILYIISIIAVGIYSYYIAQKSILERTYNQLTSVRVEKAKHIERFFDDRINEIQIIINTNSLNEIMNTNLNSNIELDYLQKFLNFSKYYNKIFLIKSNLEILSIKTNSTIENQFSNDNNLIKNNYLDSLVEKIIQAKKVVIQDFKIRKDGSISFYIGSPVFSSDNDKLLGFIVFEIVPSNINNIMYDVNKNNGLGKSGESYIVGNDLLLRTSSRFKENSIKNIRVNTIATRNSFRLQSGTEIIKDYRNIEVLSSYAPFNYNNLKWAVIAEIDKEEALEPIYDLRNSIIILCLIVSIFIFGLVYFGSTKLTTPIIMLKDAATKISKGDYDIRVNNKNNDEIGELIDAFNNMAEQLSIQSKQIEQDKLLRISSVIDAQENERQRLSRDLHDGLGQMLLAVKMKLEQAKKSSNEKNTSSIAEAIELIKNTIAEIRTISNDLMPTVLANFGLAEGLTKLCRDSLQNPLIKFNYECNNLEDIKLDEKEQIYIFRIIQELMNNIIKHSNSTEAQIKIYFENDTLNILVNDNGMGFDSSLNKSGNGLKNILERTKLLSGSLLINSIINQGTTIQITIPVQYGKN